MVFSDHDAARRRVLDLVDNDETVFLLRNSWHCHERFSQAEVIEALDAAAGLVTMAARRLNCSGRTIHNYITRYSSVRTALATIRAELCDMAMAEVRELVKSGHAATVVWYLSTFGASRGYGRVRVKSPPVKPTEKFAIAWNDLDLPPETRRVIQEALVPKLQQAS